MAKDSGLREIEDEGELHVYEEILKDAQEHLAWLTRPDYKPEENPDDELRETDIEALEAEIADAIGNIRHLKKRLGIADG